MKHTFNPAEHIASSGMLETKTASRGSDGKGFFAKFATLILLTFLFTANVMAQGEYPTIDIIVNTEPECPVANGEIEVDVTDPVSPRCGPITGYIVEVDGTVMTTPPYIFTGLASGSYVVTVQIFDPGGPCNGREVSALVELGVEFINLGDAPQCTIEEDETIYNCCALVGSEDDGKGGVVGGELECTPTPIFPCLEDDIEGCMAREYTDDGGPETQWNYDDTAAPTYWTFCPNEKDELMQLEFQSWSVHEDDLFVVLDTDDILDVDPDADGISQADLDDTDVTIFLPKAEVGVPNAPGWPGKLGGGKVTATCDNLSGCLIVYFAPVDDTKLGAGWRFKATCEPRPIEITCPDDTSIPTFITLETDNNGPECGFTGLYTIPTGATLECAPEGVDEDNVRVYVLNRLEDGEPDCEDLDNPRIATGPFIPGTDITEFPLPGPEFENGCYEYYLIYIVDGNCDEDWEDDCEVGRYCIQRIWACPPALVCNDKVNVALNGDCTGYITPDHVLEGPCLVDEFYVVELEDGYGKIIKDNLIGPEHIGTEVKAIVKDMWGNVVNSCWTKLNIEDNIPPYLDLPEDDYIFCGMDNEDGPGDINIYKEDLKTSFEEGEDYGDNCGDADIELGEWVFMSLDCTKEDPYFAASFISDPDDCSPGSRADRTFNKVGKWIRTITVRSSSAGSHGGNELEQTQTIFVLQPKVSRPENAVVECDDQIDPKSLAAINPHYVPFFWIKEGRVRDGQVCSERLIMDYGISEPHKCGYAITFSDSEMIPTDCGFKVFRTYQFLNWCNPDPDANFRTATQVIKIEDSTEPTLTCEFADGSGTEDNPAQFNTNGGPFSCSVSIILPIPVPEDNCDENPSLILIGVFDADDEEANNKLFDDLDNIPGACDAGYYAMYEAVDNCGNVSERCRYYFEVTDDDDPVCAADGRTVVPVGDEGSVVITANNLDSDSYDNCTPKKELIREIARMKENGEPDVFTDKLELSCADIEGSCEEGIPVFFRVTDKCGNFSICMVDVAVQDKKAPEISCPADITLACEDVDPDDIDALFGTPTAVDNCDPNPIIKVVSTEGSLNDCGIGKLTRTWVAEDLCGNQSTSCSQTVTVSSSATYKVTFPADITVSSCSSPDALPTAEGAGVPTVEGATAPCQNILFKSKDSDDFEDRYFDQEGNCVKIVRNWCVIDWCVFDSQKKDFKEDPQVGERMFQDGGDGIICYTQIIKVIPPDNPAPECRADKVVKALLEPDDKGGLNQLATFDPEDVLSNYDDLIDLGAVVTINDLPSLTLGCGEREMDIVVSIKVLYQDGSEATCEATIRAEDTTNPLISCRKPIIVLEADETVSLSKNDLIQGVITDNCNEDAFLRSTVNIETEEPEGWPNSQTDPSPAFGLNGAVERVLSFDVDVMDDSGNSALCEATVTLKLATAKPSIAGTIQNARGEAVDEVTVDVNNGEMPAMKTATDGAFYFSELEIHGNYTITPEKDLHPLNGVSTFDLVLISQHILGTNEFTSPYQRIAADVNKSGSISVGDMVEIRQLILNKINRFPNNTSWRFVDGDYIFSDPTNPWSSPFPEVFNLVDLAEDKMDMNFMAIKVGDVDGNASPNELIRASGRNANGILKLNAEDRYVARGEQVTLALTAKDFRAIQGFQFALSFDQRALEFVDVRSADLSDLDDSNFGYTLLDEGVITASWNEWSGRGINLDDDAVLLEMSFTAQANGQLSELIRFNPTYLSAEAYSESAGLMDLTLQFGAGLSPLAQFELFQNKPNPFRGDTQIGFTLPQAGSATLTVYDVAGRSLRQIRGDYAKGYNEIRISKTELDATGVMYYRLDTDTNSATRKMVIIE